MNEGAMHQITLRQHNQVTLPPAVVAALGVRVGDVGVLTVLGSTLIVRFRGRESAQRALESAHGTASGVWGSTHDEMNDTIDRDRESWNRARI